MNEKLEDFPCLTRGNSTKSGGRITIPKEIREKLGIEEGTSYEMEVYGEDKTLITVWTR